MKISRSEMTRQKVNLEPARVLPGRDGDRGHGRDRDGRHAKRVRGRSPRCSRGEVRRRAHEPLQHRANADAVGRHHLVQQLLRIRRQRRQGPPLAACSREPDHQTVEGYRRRGVRQARGILARPGARRADARGTRLPPSLRRRMVDGHSVGRVSVGGLHQEVSAHREGQIRGVRQSLRCAPDADEPASAVRLAVHRRAAHGRSDASAGDTGRRPLPRTVAAPERRADSSGRSVEIRLQEHQIDRANQLRRGPARGHISEGRSAIRMASMPT